MTPTKRLELLDMIAPGSRVVEVGVNTGTFSRELLEHDKQIQLFGIDMWIGRNKRRRREQAEQVYREFGHRAVLLFADSADSAAMFADETFDLIYIDAGHMYRSVARDIAAWWSKCKRYVAGVTGIFAGHDYIVAKRFGVIQAVDEFAAQIGQQPRLVPKNMTTGDYNDTLESWYFHKES